jgi:hypothetical protein
VHVIASNTHVIASNTHVIAANDTIISWASTVCPVVRLIMSPNELIDSARGHVVYALRQVELATLHRRLRGQSNRLGGEYDGFTRPSKSFVRTVGLSSNGIMSCPRPDTSAT